MKHVMVVAFLLPWMMGCVADPASIDTSVNINIQDYEIGDTTNNRTLVSHGYKGCYVKGATYPKLKKVRSNRGSYKGPGIFVWLRMECEMEGLDADNYYSLILEGDTLAQVTVRDSQEDFLPYNRQITIRPSGSLVDGSLTVRDSLTSLEFKSSWEVNSYPIRVSDPGINLLANAKLGSGVAFTKVVALDEKVTLDLSGHFVDPEGDSIIFILSKEGWMNFEQIGQDVLEISAVEDGISHGLYLSVTDSWDTNDGRIRNSWLLGDLQFGCPTPWDEGFERQGRFSIEIEDEGKLSSCNKRVMETAISYFDQLLLGNDYGVKVRVKAGNIGGLGVALTGKEQPLKDRSGLIVMNDMTWTSKLFYDTFMHEVFHILGIGTSMEWDKYLMQTNAGTIFVGDLAKQAYGELVGNRFEFDGVPLRGSAHWGSSICGEVMSTCNFNDGEYAKATTITLAALQDLGWTIDSSMAISGHKNILVREP